MKESRLVLMACAACDYMGEREPSTVTYYCPECSRAGRRVSEVSADEAIAKTCERAADMLARLHSCGEAGVYCDSDVHLAVRVLRSQANEARSWKDYAEAMPSG